MPKQKQPLLKIKRLHTGFYINEQLHHAISDINLTVNEGEIICIVGESGCGKSVLSLSIMQLLPKLIAEISEGEIIFAGENLVNKTTDEMNKIRGKEISMIFQEPMTALNPVFTIGFHLTEVFKNHTNLSKKEAREKAISLLTQVGISRPESIVDDYPHQLSGGMRQRVMIAIAIALNPKLLIADEPTTALDVTIQAQILELLRQIHHEHGMSIMLVTHDLGVVAEMAERVVVMYAGQIVESATVKELFQNVKHPYTEALLGSVPHLDHDEEMLLTIKGVVPSIEKMPKIGCRFADRCMKAFSDCAHISPQLAQVDDNHYARCLLHEACYPKDRVQPEEVK
ncbi:ABC transporter ATP-binding protein [Pseudogracilibacillus sp. SO30301A]|uniref:ABC transporter ATP-binding protein n=1 Tax=Pseudogracilibacillus sp. SO30301A TaxID=3098291 RepID=UPI00300DFEBF